MTGYEIQFKKINIGNEKQKLSISELPRRPVENCLLTAHRSINLIVGILELSKKKYFKYISDL